MPKICIIQILHQKENPIPTPPPVSFITHTTHYIHHKSLILVLILSRTALHSTDQVLQRDLANHAISPQNNIFSLEQPCDVARSCPFDLQKKKKNLSSPPEQNVSFNAVNSAFIYLFVGWDGLAKARRGKEKNRSKKRTLTGKHPGS